MAIYYCFFFIDIVIHPQAVNVSINAVAEFTCTAVGNTITWRANGLQLDNDEETTIKSVILNGSINIRMSTLSLTVTSTNNATNITCFAVNFSPSITTAESHPVLLMVQGRTDAPMMDNSLLICI